MSKKTFIAAAAIAAATLASAPAMAAEYAIDPSHTFATFEMPHFGTSTNRGRFDKKEGKVMFDKAAKTGSVELTIDMTSINSGTAAFDKHLKSPDIFDAEAFPTATFKADKLVFNGDAVAEVPGMLTLKGKTQPVTLKANNFKCYDNPMLKREVCGGDFETTFDRTAFGVDYGLKYGVPKEVKVIVQVEAIKQ
ncbi:YceI family protein [Hydrogenophaga sp. 5NK40-0174]|uniref:YceI family protein n=1 Tax=Hydrogenophaga sp. 5NK40-0174 TaxID=3127649 RepID=UPI0031086068